MFRLLTALLFSGALLVVSCSEPDMPGLDLQPASEQPGIFHTDTFTILTYTVPEDTLVTWSKTKNAIEAPTLYLGSLDDPQIGSTHAGFVGQIRIGNTITSSTFGGLSTPDSVVLVMGYKDLEGDTAAEHHIKVYELNESLYADSIYYSNRVYAHSTQLGDVTLRPNLVDSIEINGETVSPQLRIPLDTAFGGRLMREYATNPGVFADNTAFFAYLKGLKVESEAVGTSAIGSMLTLSSTSTLNRLILYYGGNQSYEFALDANCVRMPFFTHTYLPQHTDQVADAQLAVASMAGLKDSLVIPHLAHLYDNGPVSINKAELVVDLQSGTVSSAFEPHNSILALGSDSIGLNTTIIDLSESGSYYGGTYNATNTEYRINIARHVQRTLKKVVEDGGKDYGLFLVAGGSLSNARRTILKGNSEMKLIVTYTKVNP